MPISEKNIMSRLYLITVGLLVFAVAVVARLIDIQMVKGDTYKAKAMQKTERMFTIAPNRGNIYADDGSLLAASVAKYEIRFDANTVKAEVWEENIGPLCDSLGKLFHKSSSHYLRMPGKARANRNGYKLIAKNISYLDYARMRKFPMFKWGPNKGGFIEKHKVVREYPLGKIGARSIGYERIDENGYFTRVGLDGAFGSAFFKRTRGQTSKTEKCGESMEAGGVQQCR